MHKLKQFFVGMMVTSMVLTACSMGEAVSPQSEHSDPPPTQTEPEIPEKLKISSDGVPEIRVYDVSQGKTSAMNIEEYVMGVVAGEMKNDWPLEALKAQAILARTFVLKFCDTKDSRYEGADISTDVSEAQAYAPDNINERIRQAVSETRGQVMSFEGDYPYAWFFAHAGGQTELPSVGLDYQKGDPEYLSVTDSPDSDRAPEDVRRWTAEFSHSDMRKACSALGMDFETIESVEIGETGASGRAKSLKINGEKISAPSLRIQLGANEMKSTLLDSITVLDDQIVFKGRGFGHGVGMSQWGAFEMAENGKTAKEIIEHYFRNIRWAQLWK